MPTVTDTHRRHDWYLFVECTETYEFRALDDGRTEHRWLIRATDRSPEGLAGFESSVALFRALAADPSWGDQMRTPIAEDADQYGLDQRAD